MNILVTGSNGFIGRNLIAWLGRLPEVRVLEFDQENTLDELGVLLAQAEYTTSLSSAMRATWGRPKGLKHSSMRQNCSRMNPAFTS